MRERDNPERKPGILQSFVEDFALHETNSVIDRYRLEDKLNPLQLEIFRMHFASRRVSDNEDNGEILDLEKNPLNEIANKTPFYGIVTKLNTAFTQAIHASSSYFRERGQLYANCYQKTMDTMDRGITSDTIIRIANMLNIYLDEKDPKKQRQLVNNYLERELP
jgi:hypothetical protein